MSVHTKSQDDGIDMDATYPSTGGAVSAAADWVRAPGLRPDPAGLERVFVVEDADLHAEDLFTDLLAHLGL